METNTPEPIPEWRDVDVATFRERILPLGQPAVLRGLVRHWPIVQQGASSPRAMCSYLLGLRQGAPVPLLTGPPNIKGRFFFRDDLQGLNFQRQPAPLSAALRLLLTHLDDTEPPAIFIESAPLPECLPDFTATHRLDLLDPATVPRIWIGNAVKVQTHFDLWSNLACVIAGRRRFTLFPPEQLPNLYPGPMDITLAGVPVSLVPLDSPDLERFPRMRTALASARVAELEPGDTLFIPYGWWHYVQSLASFNGLVNYWWANATPVTSPLDALLHSLLALRDLPPAERAVWRNLFEYYVFQASGDPFAHLPQGMHGLMGARSPEQLREIKAILAQALSR